MEMMPVWPDGRDLVLPPMSQTIRILITRDAHPETHKSFFTREDARSALIDAGHIDPTSSLRTSWRFAIDDLNTRGLIRSQRSGKGWMHEILFPVQKHNRGVHDAAAVSAGTKASNDGSHRPDLEACNNQALFLHTATDTPAGAATRVPGPTRPLVAAGGSRSTIPPYIEAGNGFCKRPHQDRLCKAQLTSAPADSAERVGENAGSVRENQTQRQRNTNEVLHSMPPALEPACAKLSRDLVAQLRAIPDAVDAQRCALNVRAVLRWASKHDGAYIAQGLAYLCDQIRRNNVDRRGALMENILAHGWARDSIADRAMRTKHTAAKRRPRPAGEGEYDEHGEFHAEPGPTRPTAAERSQIQQLLDDGTQAKVVELRASGRLDGLRAEWLSTLREFRRKLAERFTVDELLENPTTVGELYAQLRRAG